MEESYPYTLIPRYPGARELPYYKYSKKNLFGIVNCNLTDVGRSFHFMNYESSCYLNKEKIYA